MAPSARTPHVALLRGINVGGKRIVPMVQLAEVFRSAGCEAVRTYIQSGNVVFEARRGDKGLVSKLEARIQDRFGFDVPVVLRTLDELQAVVASNPFRDEHAVDVDALYVAFLADRPTAERAARLDPDRSPPDRFHLVGMEIHLHLPNGGARSKLTNAYFDGQLSTTATVRNWRTVLKLVEMAQTR
jgi:uncharacterized protein (DUF1697 family)